MLKNPDTLLLRCAAQHYF